MNMVAISQNQLISQSFCHQEWWTSCNVHCIQELYGEILAAYTPQTPFSSQSTKSTGASSEPAMGELPNTKQCLGSRF